MRSVNASAAIFAGPPTTRSLRCTQNPTIGEEWRRGWHPECIPARASEARVLIVGAGPAGLECALALGRRGYETVIAEAGSKAGGRIAHESLGPVRELSLQGEGFRADSIVPLAVEVVAGEVDGIHFGVGHLDAGRIGVLIELATNLQTGLGRRRGDQLDDDLMADERSAAPVAGDEREQAMFDLVPLAGAGGQVTHGDGNAEFVGQFL